MKVFRLARAKFASDLTGEGAKIFGGRWNSKGNRMLYTSSSRSLAILEVLVNMDKRFLPTDMHMLVLQIEDSAIKTANDIPKNWREVPFQRSTQKWGDVWLRKNEVAVALPSFVVPQEQNVLLNPLTIDFGKQVNLVSTEHFSFDTRLFNQLG